MEEKPIIIELRHLFVTVFLSGFAGYIVTPAITDVTMAALCPGRDQCSLAIYLIGLQQGIIGLGTVVMMPLIGNLADEYGRKTLLTVPLTFSIIPLVILAYSRATEFYYGYYVLRTLTAMVTEGSVNCLSLAYVADSISESRRASAFGVLTGVLSAAFVFGTLAARLLSTASTFQVAALVSMLAAVYMRVFLKESLPKLKNELAQPILKQVSDDDDDKEEEGLTKTRHAFKKIPSPRDVIRLLRSSKTIEQIAIVCFFNSLSDGGLQSSFLFYLKARFHFNKNQFADLMLMAGVITTISQLILPPFLVPAMGEKKLLSLGLFMASTNALIISIAWTAWIPYATTSFFVLIVFVNPCLRSIASKQVSPEEQGKAQGCISGITSLASIISPLIYSPLTALFLSKEAPIHFPGFSLACIGLTTMIAFIQSTMIRTNVPASSDEPSNINCEEPSLGGTVYI